MEPVISKISDESPLLKFTLSGVNVSIANAIRRIILSEIPCIVFRTSPYEKNDAKIEINTTRMNNELIKQRLTCIPIHISDVDFPFENYIMEVDKKYESDSIEYVTTADFKIKDINSEKYLSDAETKKIFPADPITGDYIDFVRLRPKISDEIPGEHLKLSCKFSIGMAKEDSEFNIVSKCSYANSPDKVKALEMWQKKEEELTKSGMSKEEIAYAKKDWELLDAKRYFINDSFDFIVQTY
jgi:DNA-directed RNA polymerase alpha subunit